MFAHIMPAYMSHYLRVLASTATHDGRTLAQASGGTWEQQVNSAFHFSILLLYASALSRCVFVHFLGSEETAIKINGKLRAHNIGGRVLFAA